MKKLFLLLSLCIITNLQARSTDELVSIVDNNNISVVNCLFTDLCGNIRKVVIPADKFEKALHEGLTFDGSSIPGFTAIYESDMLLHLDRTTFWHESQHEARIMCDIYNTDGTACATDARGVLKSIVDQARDMGYEPYFGVELEFYLLAKDSHESYDKKQYFDTDANIKDRSFSGGLLDVLQAQGIDVEKTHHEVGPGQREIPIRYNNAVAMADQIIIAKDVIKLMAGTQDMVATFMPKPIFGENGSGMHVHFSLWDLDSNCNVFYDINDRYFISEKGKQYIAGVLHYLPEFCAMLNPTVNSYKRLIPGYEAPVNICWGDKNRSSAVRKPYFPADRPNSARAELRSPDVSANPYLVFAFMIKAGLEGIKNEMILAPAAEQSLYKMPAAQIRAMGIGSLPGSLERALELLSDCGQAATFFTPELITEFLKIKTDEVGEFNRAITDWECEQYL